MHRDVLSPNLLVALIVWFGGTVISGAATGFALVPTVGMWRYLDDGSDPGTAWRAPDFDDSEWPEGAAELGYGDGDEFTTVDFGPNENSKHITTYFRHAFEVSNREAITNLTLGVLRDDGAVVYLNGQEVFRSNMPGGNPGYRTLANSAASGGSEEAFFATALSPGLLVNGRNVFAVEVHQSSADSSDLSFNLELVAIGTNDPPSVSIVSPANHSFVDQERPLLISVKAVDFDGGVVRVEFYDGNVKLGEVTQPPFDLLWEDAFSGSHTLTAVATDTSGLMRRSVPAKIVVGSSVDAGATLVPAGATWRYWDNGTDLGVTWRLAGYDDHLWLTGEGEFGYGDGGEKTTLKFGPNPSNKHVTTYFRHLFEVPVLEGVNGIRVRLLRDDGAVVYLNGSEVFRSNMPGGPFNYLTPAVRSIDHPEESFFFTTVIPSSLLVEGANLVAVELHQADPSTSDASFNLELQTVFSPIVVRGPWLQNGAPNAVTVKWNTDAPSTARVRYGIDPNNLDLLAVGAFPGTRHEVRLTGLAPATTYFYSVGNDQRPMAGGAGYFFKTPPPPGDEQATRVWVLGDSGTATVDAENVRNAYLREAGERYTDVWLMLGDNAYQEGRDVEYQAAVFDLYPSLLRQSILWSTIGNHDSAFHPNPPLTIPYFEIFTHPQQGDAGGVPSGTEKYYSFDHGNIHFICLDSMTSRRDSLGPMAAWLEDDLSSTLQPWLIAFWHHAPYTRGNHDSDHELEHIEMRSAIVPLLEAHGVDLILSGHTHSYERSMLLNGHHGPSFTLHPSMIVDPGSGRPLESGAYTKFPNAPEPGKGAVYIVAGNSGKTSGGLLNHPAMHISLNRLGSVILDVEGGRLDMRMLRENGEIGDSFTILKEQALQIADAEITEPELGVALASFEVSLSAPFPDPVNVTYMTEPGMAQPGADYRSTHGMVTFAPGMTQQTIVVEVLGDALVESNETFHVRLVTDGNVPMARQRATGTILDDEPRPSLSVQPLTLLEGNDGISDATFTFRLSGPSEQLIRVLVSAAAGSALPGEDFLATNHVVSFPPNSLEQAFRAGVVADLFAEPDEQFFLQLSEPTHVNLVASDISVLIENDDGPAPVIEAADILVDEGNAISKLLDIPVRLSRASMLPVSVDIATRDGSAAGGEDYSIRVGTVSFFPGSTNYILRLFVFGGVLPETDEVFHIDFSNALNASLARPSMTVTLVNDDGAPLAIESIRAEAGMVVIRWAAEVGTTYRVESAVDLNGAPWVELPGGVMADSNMIEISDTITGGSKFYRVVEVEQP